MGRWKTGSFTAAIGCIATGAIIVMAQYDVITYEALGYLWPALLILLGMEMLIRLFIKSDVKNHVSGWAIVLIILLVGASGAQTLLAGGPLSSLLGNTHLVSLSSSVEITDGLKNVKISIPNGRVKIEGTDGDTLDYEGSLLLPGSTEADAKAELEKKWKVHTEGDTLILELEGQSNWLNGINIGFVSKSPYLNLSIPENLAVELDTEDGSIEAFGLHSGADLETSNGTLDIHDMAGGLTADTSNGTMSVQNIKGGAKLVSSNGAITLSNVDGAVTAKSSNGKITINSAVTGDWKASSSNGKIVFSLPAVTNAKITAETSSGSLSGNVPWDRDGDNKGTAQLGSGTYTVELSTSNGSVAVDTAE
ncbi:DUF4097 family beta strand repeat-containing protein [Paenibacillus donghaensis]|uniref:Uncharacterized protein n=1 Tax=Paenibacillus donghaensis TaxID=414771 RepID=A0A2Z2K8N3_9BACL|nr:DUF4097 family beta strand repeat-containing protein [Paenibacillus donghaensis]ASA19665.1 hypothetical protein B9T62_01815 [Paenibacillus donghaensis]